MLACLAWVMVYMQHDHVEAVGYCLMQSAWLTWRARHPMQPLPWLQCADLCAKCLWQCRPKEAQVRERLWLTMNKDYVEQQAAKHKAADVLAKVRC